VRLTPIRRQVLEVVWGSHDPIGAYDIIAKLPRADRPVAPMTVYRALDFLVEQGLVHRLDSLNAFIGCDRATEQHAGQLLVCHRCARVTEIDDPKLRRALDAAATAFGFRCDASVEIKGVCAECAGRAAA
jgi:Fur family zinc uptake transcriptional regulator